MSRTNPKPQIPKPKSQRLGFLLMWDLGFGFWDFLTRIFTSLRTLRCCPFEVEGDQQVLVRDDLAVHGGDPLRSQFQLVDLLNELLRVLGPALGRLDFVTRGRGGWVARHEGAFLRKVRDR